MNFYDWMIGKYLGKDNLRGDLAQDMKRCVDFPKVNSKECILNYLHSKNACEQCIGVFQRCWRDYERVCH